MFRSPQQCAFPLSPLYPSHKDREHVQEVNQWPPSVWLSRTFDNSARTASSDGGSTGGGWLEPRACLTRLSLLWRSGLADRSVLACVIRSIAAVLRPACRGLTKPKKASTAVVVKQPMCRRLRRKPESQGRHPANSYPPAFSLSPLFSLGVHLHPPFRRRPPQAPPSWRVILAQTCGVCDISHNSR
jgi:hypothetical protein